jgi:heat shock protein HslJ
MKASFQLFLVLMIASVEFAVLNLIGFMQPHRVVNATERRVNDLDLDSSRDKQTQNQTPMFATNAISLEGFPWYLVSYTTETGETVTAKTFVDNPKLQLSEGKVSGNATCNRFFGTYVLEDNELSIQPGGTMLMTCPNEFMPQEQRFLTALEQVTSYQITNAQLRLLDTDENILLTFDRTLSPALTSYPWELIVYNNGQGGVVSVITGTKITATFDPNGGITGFAGCNNYLAEYTMTADSLEISSAVSTRKFCGQPEGVMAQESAYLQALSTAAAFIIKDNTLTLRTASGEMVAQFKAAEMSE